MCSEHNLTPELIAQHGLSPNEYKRILTLLGREPTYTELGIFSVMWSEHCSYKSSKLLLKKLPTKGKKVLQGPGENAGIISLGNGLALVFKIESHNHPSLIEPYQGAATGVGGILRDIFTMGARPIALLDSLRFGPLTQPKNRYLLEGVVAGIAGYGNCIGVPTVGGEVYFHKCYQNNILVNVMALGIVKEDRIFRGKAQGVGNLVIYVGAKTGRDGIHGATMASEEFSSSEEQKRPTVQVGDPFTEKLLLEACLELMKHDYITGIQDMGAAGLTCSSVEMANRGGTGIELDLDKVPCREAGMTPYEIMLSESQERMLLVAPASQVKEIITIFNKWDLEAVVLGRVIAEPILRIRHKGELVAELPIRPLTEEAPVYRRRTKKPRYLENLQRLSLNDLPLPRDYGEVFLKLISDPNSACKEWIYQQYDHMVRTNTIILPGADAGAIRIKGTQIAVGLTVDGNSRYCFLDPYLGARIAVAEASRNLACIGAQAIGVTDCLNFGNPERPTVMWYFEQTILGIREACRTLKLPVISGNVSFYNETRGGEGVYPTPVIGMVGIINDEQNTCTHWFKEEGDLVVLLGETYPELGGSEYLALWHGRDQGKPPKLRWDRERPVQEMVRNAIKRGYLTSAHDCSEGGLAIALAEGCFPPPYVESGYGAQIVLPDQGLRPDVLLFSESQSRIIVSLNAKNLSRLKRLSRKYAIPLQIIGQVIPDKFRIEIEGWGEIWNLSVAELRTHWQTGITRYLSQDYQASKR
jgi:phosphoribosylformylglycinamidine synthase